MKMADALATLSVTSIDPPKDGVGVVLLPPDMAGDGILCCCYGEIAPTGRQLEAVDIKIIDVGTRCKADTSEYTPATFGELNDGNGTLFYELHDELSTPCCETEPSDPNRQLCIQTTWWNDNWEPSDPDSDSYQTETSPVPFKAVCKEECEECSGPDTINATQAGSGSKKATRATIHNDYEPIDVKGDWLRYINLRVDDARRGNRLLLPGGTELRGSEIEVVVSRYSAQLVKGDDTYSTSSPSGVLPSLGAAGVNHKFPESPLLALCVRQNSLGADGYSVVTSSRKKSPTVVELNPLKPIYLQHNSYFYPTSQSGLYDVWVRVVR